MRSVAVTPKHRRPSTALPTRRHALAWAAAVLLGAPLALQAAGPVPLPTTLPTSLPQGLTVTHGHAQVATQGAQMTVRNSAGAILNWQRFDIGAAAGVHFEQANAASKVLNRVTGSDPSAIFGSLTSNGQVWLLNPNGVLFGAGARVDVAGLVASTLRLDDNAFLGGLRSGRFEFGAGPAGATVRNEGDLRTAYGGHLLLLAERVENAGTAEAPGGRLTLAGAAGATLVDSALPHLAVQLPAGEVTNLGRAIADGGAVDVYAAAVNQQGLVRADSLALDAQGRVVLRAADTLMLGSGSHTQAAGGAVDLLGTQVGLAGTAAVDVSGVAGGGTVRVGGGLMGQDRSVPNAHAVYIGPEATIRADALGARGDGGTVTVWSDAATRAYGSFSARGGAEGGNGGFVETSGGWIDARPAKIDVAARFGRAGTWLIDPNDLYVVDGATDFNITGGPVFTTTGDSAFIATETIAAALNAGTSVTLATALTGGSEPGDIFFDDVNLIVTPPTGVTLTVQAARDIVVYNTVIRVDSGGSPLNLDFQAAGNGAFGVISIESSSFSTAGGNVTLGGTVERQLPLPGGGLTADSYRPARAYSTATGGPSSALGGGMDAVRVESSVFELGVGTFRAVGEGALDASDAVIVASNSGDLMRIGAAHVQLIGHAPAPTAVDLDRIGVVIFGQNTEIVATQSIFVQAAGDEGGGIDSGARVTLAGSGTGSFVFDGRGGARPGVTLYAWDTDFDVPGRGTRLTVVGGTLNIVGQSAFGSEALRLDNTLGAPGPLMDLSAAGSGAALLSGGGTGANVTLAEVDLVLGGPLRIESSGLVEVDLSFLSGSGTLALAASGISLNASTLLADGGALNLEFVTTGATPQGVRLANTIVETGGGNITFGDLRTVSSSRLGDTTTADHWVEYSGTDSRSALDLIDSTLDAGSGAIVGGGASSSGSFDSSGVELYRSVLQAATIRLAGRSDFLQGTLVDESTLIASATLSLDGASASNFPPSAYGLYVGPRSLLQLSDPSGAASSAMSLSGLQLNDGIGVLLAGGPVGSGLETRVVVEGADLTVSGTSNSGTGLALRGDAAGSGGLLVSAAAARSAVFDGQVLFEAATGGTGTGLELLHARVVGPQTSADAPLTFTANGGLPGQAGLRIDFSNTSSGGITTIAGNSVRIGDSLVTGDGDVLIYAMDAGAAAGGIAITESQLQVENPGARIFAGQRGGGAAIGVDGLTDGTGVWVHDSLVRALGAGGEVELRGQGASLGGVGVMIDLSPVQTHSLVLAGTGVFNADGVSVDDSGGIGPRSTLTVTHLTVNGIGANDPSATTPNRVGVRFGLGSELLLGTGGDVLIEGDSVLIGSPSLIAPYLVTGAPASFTVRSTGSMNLALVTLDFNSSATPITLTADSDDSGGGRVRLDNSTLITGGGDLTVSGVGVRRGVAGVPPVNFSLRDGASGLLLQDVQLEAGSGTVRLTGTYVNDGTIPAGTAGGAGVYFGGANSLNGATVELFGDGGDLGHGIDIGTLAPGATLSLGAVTARLSGRGSGIDPVSGEPYAGVRLEAAGSWSLDSALAIESTDSPVVLSNLSFAVPALRIEASGSGAFVQIAQSTLEAGSGELLVLADGGATVTESTLTTLGASARLVIGAAGDTFTVGTPGRSAGAGVTVSDSLLTAAGAGAALEIRGAGAAGGGAGVVLLRSSLAANGLLSVEASNSDIASALQLGESSTLSGTELRLTGINTGAGLGVDLNDPSGSPSLTATAGPLTLSAGLGLGDGGVSITGGWLLSTPDLLTIEAPGRLALGLGGSSGPLFSATGVFIDIASATEVRVGSASGTDGALLTAALAGLPSDARSTLHVEGGGALLVDGTLAAPGRLHLLADRIELLAGAAVAAGGSGDALLLTAADGGHLDGFDNAAGAGALAAPAGRWVILAGSPLTTALGGLAPAFSAYGLGSTPWTLDAGGDYITPMAGDALGYEVTPFDVSGTVPTGHVSRVYDATTLVTLDPGSWTVSGLLPGDTLLLSGIDTATLADKAVGVDRPLALDAGSVFSVVDASGAPVFGYDTPSFTATITPRPLAITGTTVASKVYDATTLASLGTLGTVTPLAGDVVGVGGTVLANFADKNVGTAKPVTATGFVLTGADAGNYTLVAPTGLAGDITPLALPVTGLSALDKVYDTTTAATLAGTAGIAPLAGDAVLLAGSAAAAFADKNVGTAKPVTVSGYTLTGADAANYTVVQPAGLAADITPASLVVSGLGAVSRVYDRTTVVALLGTPSITPISGDAVTLAGTASGSFATAAVGTAKPVAVAGLSLAGADAGNYLLVAPAGLTADVTPLALALTGTTVASKVYDATRVATLATLGTVSPLTGDVVGVGGTVVANFDDKNVGTAKPVTATGFVLTGADAGNYTLVAPSALSGDITPLALPVTGLTALDKVYDATTTATLAGTAGIAPLAGDSVVLAGSAAATFGDKNVGTAKPVTVSGYTLTGADAANYTLVQPAGLAADITPASLVVSGLSAVSRVYDRTTVAALTGTPAVVPLAGDSVTVSGTPVGSFGSAAVGTAKPVAVGGLLLAGTDAGNYLLVAPATLVADVTPATLTLIDLVASNRTYTGIGDTFVGVSGALAGVFAGDAVGITPLIGTLADGHVGSAKPVAVSSTLTGGDAGNYVLAAAATTVDITPAPLTLTATPVLATLGAPPPALTGSLAGFVGGDTPASAISGGTLVWSSPGPAATVPGSYAITGSGLVAPNYVFVQDPANATAYVLRTPTVSDPVTTAMTVTTSAGLAAVSIPVSMSTPTEGRTLDVTPAFAGSLASLAAATPASLSGALAAAGSEIAGGLAFPPLDFSRLPRDEIQSLLAARARYKQQVFAKGVYALQEDPTLADVRACRTEAEIDTGLCLITEQLKQQIQAARAAAEEARRQAEAATVQPGQTPQTVRGQRRVVQAALPVIERKLALLIGVNDYKDKVVPQLLSPVPDARAVRDRLEQRLGYETTVLENPTREQIVRAFNRLAVEARPQDSVVVYFGGHGVVVPVDGVDTGFWLPSDIDSTQAGTWLANADIARLIGAIGSRQVMLVSDSCYSGRLVGREKVSVGAGAPDELLKRRAAIVLSSGGDEPVSDEGKDGHSVFAWHFMQALDGLDGWQAGNNLYERLRTAVYREFPQTPQYGGSRGLGHEGDTDYLFERREIEAAARP